MALDAPDQTALQRTNERRRVALARVEPNGENGGRRCFRLHSAALGANPGALAPSSLSFLSVERLDALPLRATRAAQTHETLTIEAETSGHERSLRLDRALVVLSEEAGGGSAPVAPRARGGINYLTRDFTAFRTLLLDRISALAPTWKDRTSADVGVMLTEVLAYLADGLAYEQDAVATETYLTTARRRMSIRRHARLLGYWLDQGVSARVWAQFHARERLTLPRGTRLLAAPVGRGVVKLGSAAYEEQRAHATAVFETMEALDLRPELASMQIWDRGQRNFSLLPGATSVDIVEQPGIAGEPGGRDGLRPGDVLLLAHAAGDLPPHPVRVTSIERFRQGGVSLLRLAWAHADAPDRELFVTRTDAGLARRNLTLVTGNVVLADFGETTHHRLPTRRSLTAPYAPELPSGAIVSVAGPPPSTSESAAACTRVHDEEACPAIVLRELTDLAWLGRADGAEAGTSAQVDYVPRGVWLPVPDRLSATPFSSVFVAEAQEEGWTLSFGDGVFGRAVPLGAAFEATYRAGDTSQSHVGARALTTVVAGHEDWEAWSLAGLSVSNPLPAVGGRGEETLEHARQSAPAAIHRVNAAVTLEDYATIARRVGGVADAVARLEWTGSFSTTFVHVRVSRDVPMGAAVLREVELALAQARLAGRVVAVREPAWVPLRVRLGVALASGFTVEETRAELRAAFVARPSSEHTAGFFDPSRWSFGETVYASAVVTWARGVRGVARVELAVLAKVLASNDASNAPADVVLGRAELPQVLDAPFHPETGSIEFDFGLPAEGWRA